MCEVEGIKAAATVASVISIQTYDALLKKFYFSYFTLPYNYWRLNLVSCQAHVVQFPIKTKLRKHIYLNYV